MRRHFSTIDSKTNYPLVYSECSYNMACMQLEHEKGILISIIKPEGNMKRIEFSDDSVFLYDEDRGYLLKKDDHARDLEFV